MAGKESNDCEQDLLIIPLPDTCAKPNAMMVELHDAVVADVAMRCSDRPEDVASLTELKLENNWRVRHVHLQEENASRP